MYKFYKIHLKSDKYIHILFLLLLLYFAIRYYIIKNKQNFKFLLPEKSAFDYFLLIRDNFIFEMSDFTTQLRQINGIVAVFTIANSEFELAEHLTF